MRHELKVILPVSAENAALINVIAAKAGWTQGQMNPDDTPRTPTQVCSEILSRFIAMTVSDAFDWYFGESQKATREQVLADVQANLVVTFEPKEESEP